jgi:hypothetical protein
MSEREVKPYGPHDMVYREFHIGRSLTSYTPATDWCYVHDDYDGAPDSNDKRCGYGHSIRDCQNEIDAWWDDQAREANQIMDMHDRTIAMVKAVVGID